MYQNWQFNRLFSLVGHTNFYFNLWTNCRSKKKFQISFSFLLFYFFFFFHFFYQIMRMQLNFWICLLYLNTGGIEVVIPKNFWKNPNIKWWNGVAWLTYMCFIPWLSTIVVCKFHKIVNLNKWLCGRIWQCGLILFCYFIRKHVSYIIYMYI